MSNTRRVSLEDLWREQIIRRVDEWEAKHGPIATRAQMKQEAIQEIAEALVDEPQPASGPFSAEDWIRAHGLGVAL